MVSVHGVFRRFSRNLFHECNSSAAKSIESPPECGVLEHLEFMLPTLLPREGVKLRKRGRVVECALRLAFTRKCTFLREKEDVHASRHKTNEMLGP